MPLRRSTAMLAGTLLLAVPLAGCGINGMDAATNRDYTPAAGANSRDAAVDVLGAVVVSAQDGSGTFIATFVNNDPTAEATVTGVAAAPEGPELTVASFPPITIPAQGLNNLAAEGSSGIPVSGDFAAGDFVALQLTLGDGETVALKVPVVPDDEEFANEFQGLDTSGAS